MQDGRDRRGEAAGHRDDLIPAANLPVSQLGRGQHAERDQVRRGTAVDQMGVFHADPCREILLELLRETPRGQPEVQRGVRQCAHFLFIKNAGSVIDPIALTKGHLFLLEIMIVFRNKSLDLFPCFFLIFPVCHCFSSLITKTSRTAGFPFPFLLPCSRHSATSG